MDFDIPPLMIDPVSPLDGSPAYAGGDDDLDRRLRLRHRDAMIGGLVNWCLHDGQPPSRSAMMHAELFDTTARRVYRAGYAVERFMKRLFPEPEQPKRLTPYARGYLGRGPLPGGSLPAIIT